MAGESGCCPTSTAFSVTFSSFHIKLGQWVLLCAGFHGCYTPSLGGGSISNTHVKQLQIETHAHPDLHKDVQPPPHLSLSQPLGTPFDLLPVRGGGIRFEGQGLDVVVFVTFYLEKLLRENENEKKKKRGGVILMNGHLPPSSFPATKMVSLRQPAATFRLTQLKNKNKNKNRSVRFQILS